jgi:hypothetical protein
MPDGLTVAAGLLVAGPAIGTLFLMYPPFWRVWTVPRAEHLALVAAHPVAWRMANVGFTVATLLTAAGLAVLAVTAGTDDGRRAVLAAAAVVYAIAGALWCAVVGIRTRTTPAVAAMVSAGTPTEPGETLLGAAIGGLFASFVLGTGGALVAVGLTLAVGGVVAAPVAWFATLIAALVVGSYLVSGDAIPAVLYGPTLAIGLALLVGWT